MNAPASLRGTAFGPAPTAPVKKKPWGWIILVVLLLLGGTAFWYYFFGQKPKVVLTVALPAGDEFGERGMWPLGGSEVLVRGGSELKLIQLTDRSVKWSAKVPAASPVDPTWRTHMNARLLRLQQWSEELTRKRAQLSGAAETKKFNEEAAKYQAELAAVRAAAANPPKSKSESDNIPAPPALAVSKAAPAKAASPVTENLKGAVHPEVQLLEQRIKRRSTQISTLAATVDSKKRAAKTEIQLSAAADDEKRLLAMKAEQQADETKLGELKGAVGAGKVAAVAKDEDEEDETDESAMALDESYEEVADPFVGVSGKHVWLIDGERALAFDRASGALRQDVALAGPSLGVWSTAEGIFVVAAAGADARQVMRIQGNNAPVSLYVPAGKVESPVSAIEEGGIQPNVQALRTEFTGGLLQANIRLSEKKLVARDSIKPGSDDALTKTINDSAAHSTDEIMAIAKLMENDAKRLSGETKFWVDESSYELTLRRPFDPAVPEWKGQVKGTVQLFSTANYDLVAAGTKLLAFNRQNQKLWEATLGAPVPLKRDDNAAEICVENGDTLFFADGAFLTGFDAKTGKVLWRVPSIGIRKVILDRDGAVYAHSANLPAESLTYGASDFDEIIPVTMKIEPHTGEILWKAEKYEDIWISGGDLYAMREGQNPSDAEERVFDPSKVPEARMRVYKLKLGSGKPVWDWYQPRRPVAVYPSRKTVALLYRNELLVIHSIAIQ
jgi:hypothetical protein